MEVGSGTVLPLRSVEDSGVDDAADVEDAPDVAALGLEQVRQLVTQQFAGHDLTTLVAEVLGAQGFTGVSQSPPGADRGVDVLAGAGPLGMGGPRLAVQVKTGQAGVAEFRQLRGTMADFDADQGLLVAWAGFKGTVRTEARTSHFAVRLWGCEGSPGSGLRQLRPAEPRTPKPVAAHSSLGSRHLGRALELREISAARPFTGAGASDGSPRARTSP